MALLKWVSEEGGIIVPSFLRGICTKLLFKGELPLVKDNMCTHQNLSGFWVVTHVRFFLLMYPYKNTGRSPVVTKFGLNCLVHPGPTPKNFTVPKVVSIFMFIPYFDGSLEVVGWYGQPVLDIHCV